MKINRPAGAPPWLSSVLDEIERNFVSSFPKGPVRLPVFKRDDVSGNGLPDAKQYARCMIWVTSDSINGPAFSDGTKWTLFQGGTEL